MRVSYSQIATYRQCPLKWALEYEHGRRAPAGKPKLDLGTAWHRVMQEYYGAQIPEEHGGPGLNAFIASTQARQVIHDIRSHFPGAAYDPKGSDSVEEHLHWMFDGYLEVHHDADQRYVQLAAEHHFQIPLTTYGGTAIDLHGYIDSVRLDTDTDLAVVGDYKSVGGRSPAGDGYATELRLDEQLPTYLAALTAESGEPRFGVPYARVIVRDAARTDRLKRPMTHDERFNRINLLFGDDELGAVLENAAITAREIAAARRGNRPVTLASPEATLCKWKCDFVEVHLEGRSHGGTLDAYLDAAHRQGFTTREEREAAIARPLPVEFGPEAY